MQLPKPGDVIAGRYHVEQLLGEGGFGAVYAATDVTAPRAVAMKFVKPDAGNTYAPRSKARFQREVQMVARLRCPHTVALFDYGESDDGLLFMVFEFIAGEDLRQLVDRVGHLAPSAAIHVMRQLLAALGEAHKAGLLHRDIKPDNVRVFEFMGDPLTVKLLDFGLARATDGGHPGVTATGEFVGTPRYMAPEQLLDQPLVPATDLYCLGLVMYEMLIGPDALKANSVGQQLERLQTGHILSMPALERLGPGLAKILERLTARRPEERFQSASAVMEALDGLSASDSPSAPSAAGGPATSATVSHPATTERPVAQQRPFPLAALLVVVGILAAGVVAIIAARSDAPAEPSALPAVPARRTVAITKRSEDVAAEVVVPSAPDVGPVPTGACRKPRPFDGQGYVKERRITIAPDRWLAYIPGTLPEDEKVPFVILLHQQGHDAKTFLERGGFKPLADRHGFIIAAPGDSDFNPWEPSNDHTDRLVNLASTAADQLCIDESRIFLVGHGGGGSLADHVICSGWVAGFATHALARTRGDTFCDPIRPIPYLMSYPIDSLYEPYEGGISPTNLDRESVTEIEARWTARNSCKNRRRTSRRGKSRCYDWDCETPFRSCHVEGGHGWPDTPKRGPLFNILDGDGPEPPADYPMAEQIWEFFSQLEPAPLAEPTPHGDPDQGLPDPE